MTKLPACDFQFKRVLNLYEPLSMRLQNLNLARKSN